MKKIYERKTENTTLATMLVSFSFFFTTEIYLKWHSSFFTAISYIILIPLVCYLVAGKCKLNGESIFFSICFAVMFLWGIDMDQLSLQASLIRFLMPFVILIPLHNRLKYLDYFITKIFPVLIGLSIISYLLYVIGVNVLPSFQVEPIGIKTYNYTSYVFCVVPNSFFDSLRFHAYYDEPGVVGTITGAIIFFYYKKLNNISLVIYILAGMLSLSLFFFIAILAWVIFEIDWRKNTRNYIVVGAVLLLFAFALSGKVLDTDSFLNRLDLSEGVMALNNRNSLAFKDYFYDSFIYSSDFWTGTEKDVEIAEGSSSMEKVILLHGFYYYGFCIFTYLLFFLRNTVSWYQFGLYFGLWFALNYQRPSFDVFFFYLFFITILQSECIDTGNKKFLAS